MPFIDFEQFPFPRCSFNFSFTRLLDTLFQIHLLSKKIQILDSEGANNIENLSIETLDPEQTQLSFKATQIIISLLSTIRQKPKYLAHALAMGGFLELGCPLQDHFKVARVLVISVFRCCTSPDESQLLVNCISKLMKYQLHVSRATLVPFNSCLINFYVNVHSPIFQCNILNISKIQLSLPKDPIYRTLRLSNRYPSTFCNGNYPRYRAHPRA